MTTFDQSYAAPAIPQAAGDAGRVPIEPIAYWWNDLDGHSFVKRVAFEAPPYIATEALHPLYGTPGTSAETAPRVKFDDPRVRRVYDVLGSNDTPPKGEHWEGWVARRIVDALFPAAQPNERAAFTDQQIYDKFYFLEGLVSENTYCQIADTAIGIARATAPRTPIYQIGAPGPTGVVVWWDVPKEAYESEKKAGYMQTGIVYREGE